MKLCICLFLNREDGGRAFKSIEEARMFKLENNTPEDPVGIRVVDTSDDWKNGLLMKENKKLRQLLGTAHYKAGMYVDDGEFQDSTMEPCIDYMRDSADEIANKLDLRFQHRLKTDVKLQQQIAKFNQMTLGILDIEDDKND